jgi:hypothetical protein
MDFALPLEEPARHCRAAPAWAPVGQGSRELERDEPGVRAFLNTPTFTPVEGAGHSRSLPDLSREPSCALDARLSQDAREEIRADLLPVRIGEGQANRSPDHELVSTASERTFEPQLTETLDQLSPRDGGESGHAVLRGSSRPISPMEGKLSPR